MRVNNTAFAVFIAVVTSITCGDTCNHSDELVGEWQAVEIVDNGVKQSADQIKKVSFTFTKDKVTVRGNFPDSEPAVFRYTIGHMDKQNTIDIDYEGDGKGVGLYEFTEDRLKMCLRHGSSSKGRPSEFRSEKNSDIIYIIFKKK